MRLVAPVRDHALMHIDLHETTDTDETEFRPALAARDGKPFEPGEIPDGFYLVDDSENPQPEFQQAVIEAVEGIAETIFLSEQLNEPAGLLSHGQKQWLEIGMLLIQKPDLLMLDEPVAGMSVAERKKTAELLRVITRDHTVLVIEHDMQFVGDIADRVTVMHQGKVLSEGSIDHVKKDPKVIEVYLGH